MAQRLEIVNRACGETLETSQAVLDDPCKAGHNTLERCRQTNVEAKSMHKPVKQEFYSCPILHRFTRVWCLPLGWLLLVQTPVAQAESWQETEQQAYDRRDLTTMAAQLNRAFPTEGKTADWLWRKARLLFETGIQYPRQDARNLQAIQEGLSLVQQALKLDDQSAQAHAWYAYILGYSIQKSAIEVQIRKASEVADHLKRAIRLDPTLGAAYLALGRWHYSLADLSWVERKVASTVFSTLPEGSFAEAERLLKEGARLEPWKLEQHLWLARAQLKLGKEQAAKVTVERALSVDAREREVGTKKALQELLKSL